MESIKVTISVMLITFPYVGSVTITIKIMLLMFLLFGSVTTNILFMPPLSCLFLTISCLLKSLGTGMHYSLFGSSTALFDSATAS